MNGVIYARYSCEKQTENSILGQVRECKLFAERNGINIIDVYKDEAISGRTATKRPAFMKMIHDAGLHVFDCIIVWKGDRFSRSRADAAKYKSELKKLGVRVLSATEANVTGPEAILMDGINEAFAEYFSVELAAKVERGMTQNAIDGKFNGGRLPFGFRMENGKILIDEYEGPIVRELFELYSNGEYNLMEIMELFKNKGYTHNGEPLKKASIYRIIQNPRYYGHYEFKGTVNDNMFPAIVTKEIWDKARAIAEATHSKAGKYKAKATYLLTGKLICGECFTYMRGDSCYNKGGKQFYYYICPGKHQKGCSMESISKEKLENTVMDAVIDFLWDDEDINFYIQELTDASKSVINSKTDQIQALLNETNKSIRNITKAIEQGADFELMIPRLNELKKIKDEQEQSLSRAKLENSVFDEENIRKFLKSLKLRDYINVQDKKYLINTFIDSIYLNKDNHARIVFKFAGSNGDYIVKTGGVRLQTHSVHQRKQSGCSVFLFIFYINSLFNKIMVMKALYLYSNKTGLQSKFKKHGKIIKRLSKSFELDPHQTISVDDLSACCRDAKKSGYDAIIVCGGDGTLKDAVTAIAPLKKEDRPIIGYIPMGTVNDSGKSFGVKGSIRQALKVIEKQCVYDIDICRANNEYWTFVAAIGQFTDISYIVPRKQKKILGRFAYYNVAVKEVFTKKRINVHIKCDQGEYDFETPFLMCLNGVNVGGFRVNPHNSLFDGKMNIYITPTTIFNGLTNYIFHRSKITVINTKHAEITTSETSSWCLDGEEGMKGNLVLDVLPAHIRVFGHFKNSR